MVISNKPRQRHTRKYYRGVLQGDKLPSIVNEFPDFLKAIGAVSVNWGMIEYALVQLLAHFLNVTFEKAAISFFSFQSHKNQREFVHAIARDYLDEVELPKLARILRHVQKAAKKRNDIIHGFYGLNEDSGSIIATFVRPKEEMQFQEEKLEESDILEAAAYVAKTAKELYDFLFRITGQSWPSPKIPP